MMSKNVLPLLILLAAAQVSEAEIHRVPQDFEHIQSALDACAAGDQVRVSSGIYHESLVWPAVESIQLLGAGSADCIIDAGGEAGVLSVTGPYFSSNMEISGFTLRNGQADRGAGLMIYRAEARLHDLRITSCSYCSPDGDAYGAVYLSYFNGQISGVTIDNVVLGAQNVYGGGMYVRGVYAGLQISDLWISNCTVIGSQISRGGGLFAEYCNESQWDNIRISDCEAFGGVRMYGAGANLNSCTCSLVQGLDIRNCQSTSESYAHGGGLYSSSNGIRFEQLLLTANSSNGGTYAYGGGAFFASSHDTVIVCDAFLVNNRAIAPEHYGGGGGIRSDADMLILRNSLVADNEAVGRYAYSGGMTASFSEVLLDHVTISGNHADGSFVTSGMALCLQWSNVSLVNSIAWGHGSVSLISCRYDSSIRTQGSCIQGGAGSISVDDDSHSVWLAGNIVDDPAFCSASDTLYHLQETSPCRLPDENWIGYSDLACEAFTSIRLQCTVQNTDVLLDWSDNILMQNWNIYRLPSPDTQLDQEFLIGRTSTPGFTDHNALAHGKAFYRVTGVR